MSIMTGAYRREIDDNDGYTRTVTVTVGKVRATSDITVGVGWGPGSMTTASLSLDRARQLREALSEAIMLLEDAQKNGW
jgi:hypothetical protein